MGGSFLFGCYFFLNRTILTSSVHLWYVHYVICESHCFPCSVLRPTNIHVLHEVIVCRPYFSITEAAGEGLGFIYCSRIISLFSIMIPSSSASCFEPVLMYNVTMPINIVLLWSHILALNKEKYSEMLSIHFHNTCKSA